MSHSRHKSFVHQHHNKLTLLVALVSVVHICLLALLLLVADTGTLHVSLAVPTTARIVYAPTFADKQQHAKYITASTAKNKKSVTRKERKVAKKERPDKAQAVVQH